MSDILGGYTQPSCGERSYVRNLTLAEDGRAELEDRVSPCPEGTACMWSGIVIRNGTFTLSEHVVSLTFAPDPRADGAGGPPSTLSISENKLHGICPWTRVP